MAESETPKVYADKDGFVRCPYCGGIHRHGGQGNGTAEGHRMPDCGNQIGYIVVPHAKQVVKQWLYNPEK